MITLIPSLLLFGSIVAALPAPMPSPTYPPKIPKIDLSFPTAEDNLNTLKYSQQEAKLKEWFSDPADLQDFNFVKPQFLGAPKQTFSNSPRGKNSKELSAKTLGILRGTPVSNWDVQGPRYISRQPSGNDIPGDEEGDFDSDSGSEPGDGEVDSVFAKMQRSQNSWNKKSINFASGMGGMGGDDLNPQHVQRKGHYTSGRQKKYDFDTGEVDEDEELMTKMGGMRSSIASELTSGLGLSNLGKKNMRRPSILRAPQMSTGQLQPISTGQLLKTPKASPKGKEKRVTFSSELESERIISDKSRSQSRSPDSENEGQQQQQRRGHKHLSKTQTLSAPKQKRIQSPQQSEPRPTLYLIPGPKAAHSPKGSRGRSPTATNTMGQQTTSNNRSPNNGRIDYLLVKSPGTKIYSPESRPNSPAPRNMIVSLDSQDLLPGAQTQPKNSAETHEWRKISPSRYEKFEKYR